MYYFVSHLDWRDNGAYVFSLSHRAGLSARQKRMTKLNGIDKLPPTSRAYGKGHDSILGLMAGMMVMALSLLLMG